MLGLHSWQKGFVLAPGDHCWEWPHAGIKHQKLRPSFFSHHQVQLSIVTDPTSTWNTSLRLTSIMGRSSIGPQQPPRTCRSSISTPSSVRAPFLMCSQESCFNSWCLGSIDVYFLYEFSNFCSIKSSASTLFGSSPQLKSLLFIFYYNNVVNNKCFFDFFFFFFNPHRSARVSECLFHRYVLYLPELRERWEDDEEQDSSLSFPETHTPLLQTLVCLHALSFSSLSLIFAVRLLASLAKLFVSALSNCLPFSSFFFHFSFYIVLSHSFCHQHSFCPQPAISTLFLFHLSFDFFFFSFKFLCNLLFLALWCTFSSACIMSFPFSVSCFHLHIKSFPSFHLAYSCTFQPVSCLKRLLWSCI